MYFFWGDICFTYKFLEDQKHKQERSCEFWKNISDLSDLTPDVRSYPVLRYLADNTSDLADYTSDLTDPTSDLSGHTSDLADNTSDLANHTSYRKKG